MKSAILAVSGILFAFGIVWATPYALAYILPYFIKGYGELNGLADTPYVLLVILIWDRLFGFTSIHLRGVAKALKQAKKRSKN